MSAIFPYRPLTHLVAIFYAHAQFISAPLFMTSASLLINRRGEADVYVVGGGALDKSTTQKP